MRPAASSATSSGNGAMAIAELWHPPRRSAECGFAASALGDRRAEPGVGQRRRAVVDDRAVLLEADHLHEGVARQDGTSSTSSQASPSGRRARMRAPHPRELCRPPRRAAALTCRTRHRPRGRCAAPGRQVVGLVAEAQQVDHHERRGVGKAATNCAMLARHRVDGVAKSPRAVLRFVAGASVRRCRGPPPRPASSTGPPAPTVAATPVEPDHASPQCPREPTTMDSPATCRTRFHDRLSVTVLANLAAHLLTFAEVDQTDVDPAAPARGLLRRDSLLALRAALSVAVNGSRRAGLIREDWQECPPVSGDIARARRRVADAGLCGAGERRQVGGCRPYVGRRVAAAGRRLPLGRARCSASHSSHARS